jgi:anti-sigma factor RsiW
MLEERTVELINAELDGELGPVEKEKLQAILDSSEEARAMKAEFEKLVKLIDATPEVSPPAGLSQEILGQITLPSPKSAFSLAGLFPSFQPATAGLAFAAGLLVAVGFYELTPRHGVSADPASMVGTMVVNRQEQPFEQLDSLSIEGPGLSGTVSLQEGGGVFILNFDLNSEDTTEIEIALAEAGLGFGGIARALPGARMADESFQVSEGTLRVVNQGRQAFTVFLPDVATGGGSGREIIIGISSGEAQVFSGVLRG